MSDPSFSRPGAVDLSSLASATAPAGGGSFVTEAHAADLQDLATKSTRFPVILEFYSPRDTSSQAVSDALASEVNARGGRFLLARVNVDAEVGLAQQLGVQAVPTVMALIGGQLAPLFQGTVDTQQITAVLDQVIQLAVGNGVTGTAEPVAAAATQASPEAPPAADPRFEAADQALAEGDFERAVAEFDKLLQATPGDAEATAGRAQAALLTRSRALEPNGVAAAAAEHPDDVAAQLSAADFDVIQGRPQAAFDRLLNLAGGLTPEAREQVRVRLLELFEVVGRAEPAVLAARRRLATLLF
ncbi:MAG: tetratricopeptide repeat protein [Arachnia sp.]